MTYFSVLLYVNETNYKLGFFCREKLLLKEVKSSSGCCGGSSSNRQVSLDFFTCTNKHSFFMCRFYLLVSPRINSQVL